MFKMVFLLLSIVCLEASADKKREVFSIGCEGGFATLGATKAKHMSKSDIKKIAKTLCDHNADNMDIMKTWGNIDNLSRFGCFYGISSFIEVFIEPNNGPADRTAIYKETCFK